VKPSTAFTDRSAPDEPVSHPTAQQPERQVHRLTGLIRRRPITSFLVVIFGVVWAALGIPGWPGTASHPSDWTSSCPPWRSCSSTALPSWSPPPADGQPGVRRLLAGVVHWRIGVAHWILVVAALPALTLTTAGATGTPRNPPEGWLRMSATCLVTGLISSALLTNLWEEAAWSGFVQHRLMNRHGVLAGSVLTAVPFALIHVPGTFQNTAADVFHVVILAVLAPSLRYPIGTVLIDTRGSILAVGLLHASFNATGTLSAADGGWQLLPALLVLVAVVGVHLRLRRGRRAAPPIEVHHHGQRSTSRPRSRRRDAPKWQPALITGARQPRTSRRSNTCPVGLVTSKPTG
jgi:membrane protease YdiL (CAAX protease family)